MRKIAAGLFVSLDGVVESPEKWTGPYFNDQVGQAVGTLMAANDAMLLGRTTYEGFAAAFGGQSGGMADQMNNTPKFVVSTTLTSAAASNGPLALEATGLSKDFRLGRGAILHAVRDVNISLYMRLAITSVPKLPLVMT